MSSARPATLAALGPIAAFLNDRLTTARVGAAVLDRDGRYLATNETHARANARGSEAHLGQRVEDVNPSLAFALGRLVRQVLEDGTPVRERRLVGDDPERPGTLRTWLADALPVRDASGTPVAVYVEFHPAETQEESTAIESTAQQLFVLASELARARTVQEIVDTTLSRSLPLTGATSGGLSLVQQDQQVLKVMGATGYDPTLVRAWPEVPLALPIPATAAVNEARPLFLTFEDVRRGFPESAPTPSYVGQAHVALPLIHDEQVLGVLTLGFPDRKPFTAQEVAVMTAFADSCAQAIVSLRVLTAEREAREELNRTAALLDSVFANAPVGVAVLDPKLRFLRLNDTFTTLSGQSASAHLGRGLLEILPHAPHVAQSLALARQTKQPIPPQEVTLRDATGSERSYLIGYFPVLTREGLLIGVGCVTADTRR